MRILHLVSYAVFSGPLPGVLALAQSQRNAGHTAYVAHDAWRGNFSPYEEGADAALEPSQMGPPWPLVLSPKGGLWRAWADLVTLRRVIGNRLVDVLHCHLSHDHLLASLAMVGRPAADRSQACRPPVALVRTLHAARGARPRWGSGGMWRRTHGGIVRCRADGLSAAPLADRGPMPLHRIPGGIDAAAWDTAGQAPEARFAWRANRGIPPGAPVLVHVALMAGRGQAELLAAWARVLRAGDHRAGPVKPHLVFVGRGPEQADLMRAAGAADLRGQVHFAGYLRAAALAQLYGAVDAAFVAQPGNDGAARAVLEAMAAGLPVLAVPVGSIAETVHEGVGYVCRSRRPEVIAAQVTAWLADRAGGSSRGQAGRAWLRRHCTMAQESAATQRLYAAAQALANARQSR